MRKKVSAMLEIVVCDDDIADLGIGTPVLYASGHNGRWHFGVDNGRQAGKDKQLITCD